MVRVNNDYVIEVDASCYTVKRDTHCKRSKVDKKTGEIIAQEDVFVTIGYYGDLGQSIKGVIKDMNKRKLSEGVHDLKSALEIVVNNNAQFSTLLDNVLTL